MKNTKKQRIAALLAATVVALSGCTTDKSDKEHEAATEDALTYEQTIAALEAQLREERSSHAQTAAALQQEISELRRQLVTLGATATPPTVTPEEISFTYRVEGEGAVITSYTGNTTLLAIPATLDGYPVVAIGERAFEGSALCAVVLPEGVESVGWFAFYGCASLSSVTLPETVSSIGYAVFDGCPELTVVCPAGSFAERYVKSYGIHHITT